MNHPLERLLGVEHPAWSSALLPSFVVFLVALPLALGVALASGVPASAGVWSAVIGGVVVGRLAGAPLQVSGPAAALAIVVWEVVHTHGVAALGVVVFLAGLLQVIGGALRAGRWFRAVSPAVVHGMLAGIGLAIVGSQLQAMLGGAPSGSGLTDWSSLPTTLGSVLTADAGTQAGALVGIVAVLGIVLWDRYRHGWLAQVPGALVGVLLATAVAAVLGAAPLIAVPTDLLGSLRWLAPADVFAGLFRGELLLAAATLAAVASAEALLSATAVDRMHDGPRTDYNRELVAQGVGNLLAGVVGALPVTGMIVRSSANVAAGASNRLPSMLHGVLILAVVLAAPGLLGFIPAASLAAVLVVMAARLIDLKELRSLWSIDPVEAGIMVATAIGVVSTDLIIGVGIGFALSAARLVSKAVKLDLDLHMNHDSRVAVLRLTGAASFLAVPALADALEQVPQGYTVEIHHELEHVDHAVLDLLESWTRNRPEKEALDDTMISLRAQVRGVAQ